jgi:hypothetical protein
LLYSIVTYSYLILPLTFFLLKNRFKDKTPSFLAFYGVLFFSLLIFWDYAKLQIPKEYKGYYQILYTFLEYLVFSFIFWNNIKNKRFKKFIIIVSILFFAFQIFFATTTSIKKLDSIPVGVETIFIFIYIFYFFYEFSKNTKDIFIYNHFCFWIAVGILIYLGGSFFFYILINELDDNQIHNFGNLTFIAEIIKNLLFAFSIFMYNKFPINKIHNHPKNIPNLDMI